jgi:fructose-bisphosphate aldolase class II
VLLPAKKEHYAVGLFNAVNVEMARGILAAAEETKSPVIVGTAEVLFPFDPLQNVLDYLLPMAKRASVPVVVHLDHGLHFETCLQALRAGCSSVMFDCSALPYEENLSAVREMTKIAHACGATIEAELGHVGNADDEAAARPEQFYTDPAVAVDYVGRTGVDALAIAVGTAHGAYRFPPKLDFERIETIAREVSVPLVLHGGSGLTDEDFRKAVRCGISKVNIFTDLNLAAAKAAAAAYETKPCGLTDLMPVMAEAVKRETEKKMRLFGSCGKGVRP